MSRLEAFITGLLSGFVMGVLFMMLTLYYYINKF